MRRRNKILLWIVVPLLVLLAGIRLMPWERWFEEEIRRQLVAHGMEELEFKVNHVGLGSITFTDISLGKDSPFALDSLDLGFSYYTEGFLEHLRTGVLLFRQDGIEVRVDSLDMDFFSTPEGIRGDWQAHDIDVKGIPVPLPLLKGKGTFDWGDVVKVAGVVNNDDASHKADFTFDYDEQEKDKTVFKLLSAQLPWNGGMVRVQPVSVPVFGTKPVKATLTLERVSLNALMQQATGDRATASGALSGAVPLTITRKGVVTVQKGSLKTDDKGTITLPADVIPGDHPQVELVREVLKNFHYTDFSLSVNSDNPKKLSMLLSLKGNNPEVYNGRQVNLNVKLTGDLLDLLQQGMITIVDPKQLLNQETYEEP